MICKNASQDQRCQLRPTDIIGLGFCDILEHGRNRLRSWKLVLVNQACEVVGPKPHSLWYDCDQFRSFDQTREETESDRNPLQPPRGPKAKDVFMYGCATPSRCPTSARPCATVWLRRCPTMTRQNASSRTLHSCATSSTSIRNECTSCSRACLTLARL